MEARMFGSGTVDIVIGMLFVFLVFSLVVSGINEGITRILASRSRLLWGSLRELLDGGADPGDPRPRRDTAVNESSPLSMRLYAHPLINQLETAVRDQYSRLSYIPPTEFSRGLIDLVVPGEGTTTVSSFEAGLSDLPDNLKKPLLAIAIEVEADVEKLRQGVGEWFDERMSMLSAVYRRKAKWMLLVLGLIVAVALNVDAIDAAQQLYRDQALRTAVAGQAVNAADECEKEHAAEVEECTREAVRNVDGALRFPVGWTGIGLSDVDGWQVAGWLIAAVALSQGAPFWYDLLRKASSLRK
jgi:hypothetical protein